MSDIKYSRLDILAITSTVESSDGVLGQDKGGVATKLEGMRTVEDGKVGLDPAMTASTDTLGGIDLNPSNINMSVESDSGMVNRNDNGVPLPGQSQNFDNINIQGFTPVIINITPVTNLPVLLGLKEPEESGKELAKIEG